AGGHRTGSAVGAPGGGGQSSSASARGRSGHASPSGRSSATIWRLWIGATSGPGSVVSSVKASPSPLDIGWHKPAKQNQSPPVLVNFHFVFGDFVPVNSKKCDAGTKQRPTENVFPRTGN